MAASRKFARHHWLFFVLISSCLYTLGCNDSGDNSESESMTSSSTDSMGDDVQDPAVTNTDEMEPATVEQSSGLVIVAMGDSLTTGEALAAENYPSRLSRILDIPIINEGRGGERTAVALNRIDSILARHNPDIVLIMYGTSDVLGGWPATAAGANLRSMISAVQGVGATPLLATIPPMVGPVANLNPKVQLINSAIRSAGSAGAELVNIAGEFGTGNSLLLSDGFHPNESGTQVIAFAFADAIR